MNRIMLCVVSGYFSSTGFMWNSAGMLFIFCTKFGKGLKLSLKKIHVLKPINGGKCSGVPAYEREQLGRKDP